jgi:FkbM family methyltransferase
MFNTKALIKRGIKQSIRRAGYHIESIQERRDFGVMYQRATEALLYDRLHRVGPAFFFLQIGANDGMSFDWLYEFVTSNRVTGVVVEPLADFFAELCHNYRNHPQVVPVNAAIHRTAREVDIYRVDPKAKGLPSWTKGIASVNPDHHQKSGTASENIIVERVRCITMQELFEQQAITHIDYLQIDTEGYDSEILNMIDYRVFKPSIIKFEHQMEAGVMSREMFRKCFDTVYRAGYYLIMDRYDAVAYLPWPSAGSVSEGCPAE